jgi:membrane complex biogenesis BtpA family protein
MDNGSPVEELFNTPKPIVGMVHLAALPGTPFASQAVSAIVDQAVAEARILAAAGFDALIVENMHDRPYLLQEVGPEIVAAMAAALDAIRQTIDLPLGVQVLAGANREALAVALAGGASFIRAENFVFAHVADEGLMPQADAGPLLRYRRQLNAEHIRIFADIKKKHAAHALTADLSIADAARAAAFFGADGLIVTGPATGEPAALDDLREVTAAVRLPVAVGSGLTPENLPDYWDFADLFIVGSFYKRDGLWHQPPDPDRLAALMHAVHKLKNR